LKPNSEKYFNAGLELNSEIMIRVLDVEKEMNPIHAIVPIQSDS